MLANFFEFSVDRLLIGIAAYLKDGFHQTCFSRISLVDFRTASYLKTGLS